ncbi:MAG: nicotinate (nicotinamide) nucleotide adenylyltransferase [Oscillospiraceae bacterium]|nr:nicotinate (nicotinamide) nucleotide adenylyltransferase [Oscillospiraceae bacterium]
MRRAVFGGSFDPVHNGHVNLVKQIYSRVGLDEIIIMPTGISPFKQNMERIPANGKQRFEMCKLAFEGMPYVTVSDYEISLPDVSYTVNTVRHIKEQYPDDELFLIIGSDMLLSFHRWRNFEEILSMCGLIAASRKIAQRDISELEKQAETLKKYGSVTVVPIDTFEVSSTEIRKKIKNSSDISCYVPQNVVKYILEHGLYADL